MTRSRCAAAVLVSLLGVGTTAAAQTQPVTGDARSEDIEPRTIGTLGTTTIGFAGFVDKAFSSESVLPVNYTAQVDVGRFISPSFVLRGGLSGSGSVRGENAEDLPTGVGAPALHAFGGLLYHFTPQSMVSIYSGAEYWAQLTQRAGSNSGTVFGKFGVEGAVSSRASLFIEAGYGIGLTQTEDAGRPSRISGRIGVRLKFQ